MKYELILTIWTYIGFIVMVAFALLSAGIMTWLASEFFKAAYRKTKTYRLVAEFAKENFDYIEQWWVKKKKERDEE